MRKFKLNKKHRVNFIDNVFGKLGNRYSSRMLKYEWMVQTKEMRSGSSSGRLGSTTTSKTKKGYVDSILKLYFAGEYAVTT